MATRPAADASTERLLQAGRSLVAELDVDVVLERLLETARELTGARYAAIGVLDEQRRGLERFLTSGIDGETRSRIGELPRGRGFGLAGMQERVALLGGEIEVATSRQGTVVSVRVPMP